MCSNSPVSVAELWPIFQDYSTDSTRELILVFKGIQYKDELERQKIYNEILALIQESNCIFLVHVFLITQDNLNTNLLALAPHKKEKGEIFQRLPHEAGYYLSSTQISSIIYRNVQGSAPDPARWFKKLESFKKESKPQAKPEAYIIAQEVSENVRKSKTLTQGQLKSKVRLAVAHQEAVAHHQTVNEQIQATHTHTQNVSQNLENFASFHTKSGFSWESEVNLEGFCEKLKIFAKNQLLEIGEKERLLEQAGYLTQFYLNNHSRRHFYEKVVNDESFRLQLAAKLFGYALLKPEQESDSFLQVKLPHYFVDNISELLANQLLSCLEHSREGFSAKDRSIRENFIFGRTLEDIRGKRFNNNTHISSPLIFSKLHYLSELHSDKTDSSGFQPPLNYFVLLPEDTLSSLVAEERNTLIHRAECLLELFQPHSPLSAEEIRALEEQLLDLVGFYFPNSSEESERLKKFISLFEVHNEDNLKILLHVIICGHTKGLKWFLNLLSFLEERSLLLIFYKNHFRYASNIGVVEQLFNFPFDSYFLRVAARTPVGTGTNWPVFEAVAHQLSIYAAQNNIVLHYSDLGRLESWWKHLYAKFLAYSGSEEVAQELLNNLGQQLTSENGLCIGSVFTLEIFYTRLENLLDHAIAKHLLKEQIDEIKGISLAPMDTPYACEWNGFQVVCSEMKINSKAINPLTKAYSVSNTELLQAIIDHQPGDETLKIALFRYIGTQRLREDIAFYRKLYQNLIQGEKTPNAIYISELLCAYFVVRFTGNGYRRDMDQKAFSEEFIRFLTHHGLKKSSLEIISSCIDQLFFQLQKIPTDEQNGIQSLWSIWREQNISAFTVNNAPIPDIFLKKFPAKRLEHFLLTERENLEKALWALNIEPKIIWALIDRWAKELTILPEHRKSLELCLKKLYPKLDMKTLLDNATKIARFLEAMACISRSNPKSLVYLALDDLAESGVKVDAFLSLIELLAVEMAKHQGYVGKDKMATRFLLALVKKPELYRALPQAKLFIAFLLESFLNMEEVKEGSHLLLNLSETLLSLDLEEAQQVLAVFVPIVANEEGLQFLNAYPHLSAIQLRDIAQFTQNIQPLSLALKTIGWLLEKDNAYDLTELNVLLNQKSVEETHYLLILSYAICHKTEQDLLTELQRLKDKPPTALKQLAQVHKLYNLSAKELIDLLDNPSLEDAVEAFKQQKYRENLLRYDYDPLDVREKIAQIKLRSHQTDDELPLSEEEQASLWRDYQLIMSYMVEKPIKVKIQGVTKDIAINALNEKQFQALFKTIQDQIKQGKEVHHNQLLLIALSFEALYRTLNKVPRSTQILTLLKRLHCPDNLIHEIKTGEGKSIIAAMHGVLLCGLGRTVDIVTENNQLAKNALDKFGPFYQYLGISHGENILTAQSAHHEYIANGINYSTASNLALFRMRMTLEKKALPGNPALIGDEIDAILTTVVQYRLAATLDPSLTGDPWWINVYYLTLEFVNEKEIFLNNPCSEKDDILNLKNYFLVKNPRKEFLDFTHKISDELLGVLIESARIAHNLEKNIDYYVVETKANGKKHSYAAPIIASTKRPDPNVSYSEYVQQLLHTLLNNKKPSPNHSFVLEPSTETLVAISAKNFFDYYRLNGGPIIGLTATSGSRIERAEFYEQQGLVAFSYPTFYPDRAEDLGLVAAFGTEHLKKIFVWVETHKKEKPAQPILLITPSPQATAKLNDFLAMRTDWKLQSYHGYEEAGKTEENVIYTAGKDYLLTAANQSLARGADIEPENEEGLLVINTCTDLTPSELRQIQGRVARNGRRGQFVSIIDAQTIGTSSDSEETLAEAFKTHQHHISLKQQQERLKMRLLEEARYLLISEYVFKLREAADKLLAPQLGEKNSIVAHSELLQTLSTLNERAEKHYAELLNQHALIDDAMTDEFLAARVEDYQQMLDRWLPENRFRYLQFIEPPIPLGALQIPQLHGATVEQLSTFADVFHRLWKTNGHQQAKQYFDHMDGLVELFNPYFKNECSFKQALGHALAEKGLLNPEQIGALVVNIQTSADEMIAYAQSIPIVGRLVPADLIKGFITDYLNTTKLQIQEKKWDEINLPSIDISAITIWVDRVSQVLRIGSLFSGGPIVFIVNRYIVPTVLGWIKNQLKERFANSESLVAQVLIGLDDIANDLSGAIEAFSALSNNRKAKVGWFLDKFGPLAKNRALLLALSKYLELIELPEYIPYVQAIPDVLVLLETYRDYQPNKLLSVDTLVAFLQHASRSRLILHALEESPYKKSLERLAQLTPDFLTQMSGLSFSQFLSVLKVIAHPNFFPLMAKLPPDTTYKQLGPWIEKVPAELSEETRQAIKELVDYQTNDERVAEENKQTLLNLRKTYNLTLSKFKAGLEKLKPKPPIIEKAEVIIENEQEASTSRLGFQQVLTLLVLGTLIAYNILYFSIPITLVSLILLTWVAYPYIQSQISAWLSGLKKANSEEPRQEEVISPSLREVSMKLSGDNSTVYDLDRAELCENGMLELRDDYKPTSLRDSNHGFFAQGGSNLFKKEDGLKEAFPRIGNSWPCPSFVLDKN
jgi:hypothetical protein